MLLKNGAPTVGFRMLTSYAPVGEFHWQDVDSLSAPRATGGGKGVAGSEGRGGGRGGGGGSAICESYTAVVSTKDTPIRLT